MCSFSRHPIAILLLAVFASSAAAMGTLIVETSGVGTPDHTVTVTSPGLFKLGFERKYNYGLSQWFDLVNDPGATRDLAEFTGTWGAPQGALHNIIFYPADSHNHILIGKEFSDAPRSIEVLEQNDVRVVVRTKCSPLRPFDPDLVTTTTFSIYPSGKIGILDEVTRATAYSGYTQWKMGLIGLGDPSFKLDLDSGTCTAIDMEHVTDPTKAWVPGQWVNHKLSQTGANWRILGNTATTLTLEKKTMPRDGAYSIARAKEYFGWIPCTYETIPLVYQGFRTKCIFTFYDPNTPPPDADWARASILLSMDPANNVNGTQGIHTWEQYMRLYYVTAPTFTAGQTYIWKWMMQLGAEGAPELPNIRTLDVARPITDDYLAQSTLGMVEGTAGTPAFDMGELCYNLSANNNTVEFTMDGTVQTRHSPVFRISGYSSATPPIVSVSGQAGIASKATVLAGNVALVQLFGKITQKVTCTFRSAGTTPHTYHDWVLQNFTAAEQANAAISGPDADPDGCGLSNLARYAFDLPAHGPVANPITLGTATSAGATYLTLTFPRRAEATGLTYTLESSTDLVTWTAVPGHTYTAGSGPITAQDAVKMGAAPRRFLRVRVSGAL